MSRADRIAFIAPRFAEGPTVGGAETLLRALADRAAAAGRDVTFLTTCARNHFTWANEVPPGHRRIGALNVHFFPVDEDRDLEAFITAQDRICNTRRADRTDEETWLANGINSTPLIAHLQEHIADFDRVVIGPYLFGLGVAASRIAPEKTFLVPCLHDEAFAYMDSIAEMFRSVAGCLFNADAERELAMRLYGLGPDAGDVVGMGLDPFETDPGAARRRLGFDAPFVLYSGRRETLKGTPLLVEYLHVFRMRTGLDIKLVFTGTGDLHLPDGLVQHTVDLGFVAEQEKRDVMAAALCFCHPSVHESFSIVLMESWLARTPVLVHAGSAVMRDHCRQGGGGLWFRTYPEFEESLRLLHDDDALRARLAASGHTYVRTRYDWSAIEARMLAALDGVRP